MGVGQEQRRSGSLNAGGKKCFWALWGWGEYLLKIGIVHHSKPISQLTLNVSLLTQGSEVKTIK